MSEIHGFGQVKNYLDAWKRSLLDLSRRNRLLYFHVGMATRIQLAKPNAQALYNALVTEERTLEFPYTRGATLDDLDMGEPSAPELRIVAGDVEVWPPIQGPKELRELNRRLERLRRGTQTIWEEQGVHTLFAALGMLHWREAEHATEIVRSPLVLVPVVLERTEDRFNLRAHEDDVEVNPALAYRLQRDFGMSLAELGNESEENGAHNVIDDFFSRVRQAIGRRDWQLSEEVWLAQFAFHKLPMYRDLEDDEVIRRAAMHPVVATLCGVQEARKASEIDVTQAEDAYAYPESFPVLDVDSSQLEVLERVRQGETLVVQGPPGTGKSQTIVNLIVQALRDGKKVLFVSEKRAALEVVYRRLRELGLTGPCLDLHSHRASRKAVVEELMSTLEAVAGWRQRPDEAAFEEYRRLKTNLDAYVREIHRPRDRKGRTAYEVHGRLAKLHAVPLVTSSLPFGRVLEVEPASETEVADLVRLIAATGVWDEESVHPWRDAAPDPGVVVLPEVVAQSCARLAAKCDHLRGLVEEVRNLTGLETLTAEQLEQVTSVLDVLTRCPPTPFRDLWLKLDRTGLLDLVEFAREAGSYVERRQQQEAYLAESKVDAADIEENTIETLCVLLEQAQQAWFWRRLRTEWKVQRDLAKLTGRKFPRRVAVSVLLALHELHQVKHWILGHQARLREELGLGVGAAKSEVEAVLACLEWLSEILAGVDGKLPEQMREVLGTRAAGEVRERAAAILAELRSTLDAFEKALRDEHLTSLFPEGLQGRSFKQVPVQLLYEKAVTWEREAGKLPGWINYRRLVQESQRMGLQEFLQACRAHAVSANQLCDVYWRAYFTRWLQEAYTNTPVLASFDPESHEQLRRRFRELDKHLQQEAVKAVLYKVASAVPQPLPLSEESRLRREAAKKRRHLSLRRLFPQIPNLLLALKPCLMMSPLSVATHLPKELFQFDLVVFDEASQLPPGDAIGVLLRAKQAVILGDNKQLPPTDFFQAHVESQEETEEALDYESILDIAGACFPGPMLRWHYRSRDERLIAFSNRRFYEGKLITFPAPTTSSTETGVSFIYVPEGVYGRGGTRTNVIEANRVAEAVLEHFRTQPHRSLGVIAMSIEQRDAIEEALRRLHREHPEVAFPQNEVEPFFVKNLETVQGDERDVIIISVGYGPSAPGGPPALRFGPLNRQGGERRLNVAISRARYRMVIVASMEPEHLAGVQSRWEGPRLLAEYLQYARGGGVASAPWAKGEPESEFEAAVRDALTGSGYQVDCQVGVSSYRIDLGVRDPENPGRYLVGVECDGMTYHSSRTARDRDRIRQETLEALGWTILRVWSTDWIRDPKRATARLVETIERVRRSRHDPVDKQQGADGLSRDPGSVVSPAARGASNASNALAAGDTEGDPKSLNASSVHFAPYRAYHDAALSGRRIQSETPESLARVIRSVVYEEGPVHAEELFHRVRGLYGSQRLGRRIREALDEALALALTKRWVVRRGEFLWIPKQGEVSARGPGDVQRAPEHIAPEEWRAAVLEALRQLGVTASNNLFHCVAEAMGYGRLSADIRDRIDKALTSLTAEGRIVEWDGMLNLRER